MNNVISVLVIGGILTTGILWSLKREKEQVRITDTGIRKMAVSETFYPGNKEVLVKDLEKYLNLTESIKTNNPIRILIVPHAGIRYSGEVAAWGYRQIQGNNYDRVIVLGVSHKYDFDDIAFISKGEWETPFGNLRIDEEWIKKIRGVENLQAHENEHSLEMQTMWIKKNWPEAKIVPILISRPTNQVMTNLAFKIAENFDDKTLLVISTDLSHYLTYDEATKTDNRAIESILRGESVETVHACGANAITIGLKVSEFLKADKPILIKYKNSGDISDDKQRVVGYAAIGYPIENPFFEIPKLNSNEQQEALKIAETTLDEYLTSGKFPAISTSSSKLNLPLGAFVTLKHKGNLRGCMGEFDPQKPLYQVIIDKTIAAATNDHRFLPIKSDELKEIDIEISVMTPKRKVASWKEINLGRDGVVIINGEKAGTFLPQVAVETDWTKQEYLEQLCFQKAGLPKDCYKDEKTEIFVFQAQVFE